MDSIQPNTHSFVVQIWVAGASAESGAVVWRGQTTLVSSSKLRYFTDLAGQKAL